MSQEPEIAREEDLDEISSSQDVSEPEVDQRYLDEALEEVTYVTDPDPRERWFELASWLVPLLLYLPLLPMKFTYGDGPELLVAILNFGGAHPSGYPLLMLLGKIPAHLPIATPYFNVSLFMCALPSALTAWVLYRLSRESRLGAPASLITAYAWAFNYRVLYQSTRIEVYALHCFFIALAFLALARHARWGRRVGPKWLLAATGAVCLGLANHLMTAFMIPIVIVIGALVDWRQLIRPKTILGVAALAIAGASVYLYMPLHAMANADQATVSWNDPQTFERFWFHVTGKEYSIFRSDFEFTKTWGNLGRDLSNKFFPGVVVLAFFGLYELATRSWRLALATGALAIAVFVYISGYSINDIDTYYSPIYFVIVLWMGFGCDWFIRARFPEGSARWQSARMGALALACVLLGGLYWMHRGVALEETYGEDMSDQVVAALPERAIVFTSVDHHTFPMWYQAYVKHPDRDLVVVDRVMFGLKNKQWYRDHLRTRHPEVVWPSDEEATSGRSWEAQVVQENATDWRFFTLLARRWSERGTYTQNLGWHHEVFATKPGVKRPGHEILRSIYTTQETTLSGRRYFHHPDAVYSMDEKVACMVEWNKHTTRVGTWTFFGPDGATFEYEPHTIPENSNMSWEYLPDSVKKPGEWRCVVTFPRLGMLETRFEVVE